MKVVSSFVLAVAIPVIFVCTAPAATVAWWHFDEGTPGEVVSAGTVANETVPDVYAVPYSYAGESASSGRASELPRFARPFPGLAVYDPASGEVHENHTSMRFTHNRGGSSPTTNAGRSYYGGNLTVPGGQSLYANCRDAITVECFVCTTGCVNNVFAPVVAAVNGTKWTSEPWAILLENDGTVALRFAGQIIYSGSNSRGGTAKVNDGLWHHVAFTYDGTTVKIFVDYEQDTYRTGTNAGKPRELAISKPTYESTCQTRIGGYASYDASNGGRRFNGLIDEIRVSNVALTPDQFLRLRPLSGEPDPDTVVRIRFDGEGTLENGDGMSEIFEHQAFFATVNNAGNSVFDASDKYADTMADSLWATSLQENVSAFSQATNALGVANYIKVPSLSTVFSSGTSTNATIEFFYKTATPVRGGTTAARQALLKWGSDRIFASIILDSLEEKEGTLLFTTRNSDGSHNYYTSWTISADDGNWHHVALVLDGNLREFRAYFDYVLTFRSINFDSGFSSGYGLFLGARENGIGQWFNGSLDDFRVTKRALDPSEFLVSRPIGPGPVPLLTAALNGSYNFECANPDFSVRGNGEARTGGTAPQFVESTFGGIILSGEEGTPSVHSTTDVALNRSRIEFTTSPLYEQRAYTVEMWAKFTGFVDKDGEKDGNCTTLSAHPGLLRFVRGDSNTFDWYFYRYLGSIQGTQIAIRDASGAISYNNYYFDRVIADGRWHHYALTFETNEDNTSAEVSVYDDGVLVDTHTVPGLYRITEVPNHKNAEHGHRLLVAESSGDNPSVIGFVNSVRFSRGVLTPDQFLLRDRTIPLVVVIR